MKFIKEIYRIFTRNFLIYMSPEGMDYRAPLQELMDRDKKTGDKKPKVETDEKRQDLIKGNKFAEKRDAVKDLIKKIDLDANPDKKTQKELDLEKEVSEHSNKQFDLLEHNYRLAVKELGDDRENEKGGIREAEDILYQSTDRFISKMEVHIFKESVKKGETEGRALMVEQFLESRGIQAKGMGKHLVETLGNKLNLDGCNTKEDIEKRLEKILDNKDVLMQAVQKLINGLPKINNVTTEKKDYFWNQMKDSEKDGDNRLAAKFGDKNMGSATVVLAMRFHFNYETKNGQEDKTKPQFIVDTTTNTVYKADSPDWKKELKRICHEELNNITNIQKQSEGLKKLGKERADLQGELLNGKWWRTDLEVHKLGRLKDNPLLADVLRTSTDYQEATTREFKENSQKVATGAERIRSLASNPANQASKQVLESLASALTPERARDPNFVNTLAQLIGMIGEALRGKNPKDTLGEMQSDIEAGRNPSAEQAKAKEFYAKTLDSAKPPLGIDRLLNLYLDPTSAATDAFFNGATKPETLHLASKYKNERAPIIKKYLEDKLEVKDLEIGKDKNKSTITFRMKNDEPRMYYIEASKQPGKLDIQKSGGEPKTIDSTIAALKTAINAKDEPPKKAEQKEEPKTDVQYAEMALKKMVSSDFNKVSDLGVLIKNLKLNFKKDVKNTWKGIKDPAEKQNAIDNARIAYILQKIGEPKSTVTVDKLLDKSNRFKAEFNEAKKPKAATETPAPGTPDKKGKK